MPILFVVAFDILPQAINYYEVQQVQRNLITRLSFDFVQRIVWKPCISSFLAAGDPAPIDDDEGAPEFVCEVSVPDGALAMAWRRRGMAGTPNLRIPGTNIRGNPLPILWLRRIAIPKSPIKGLSLPGVLVLGSPGNLGSCKVGSADDPGPCKSGILWHPRPC